MPIVYFHHKSMHFEELPSRPRPSGILQSTEHITHIRRRLAFYICTYWCAWI